jgi:hypothetical protein
MYKRTLLKTTYLFNVTEVNDVYHYVRYCTFHASLQYRMDYKLITPTDDANEY